MKISHQDQGHLTVMSLRGEMVRDEAERFRRTANERMDQGVRDFVIDGQSLEAIDSPGIEALLWLQERVIDRLGQVRLAACPPYFFDILCMTRLSDRLEHHPTVEDAVQSLK